MIGSSFDFDMKGEDRIRLLNELMQLAQQVDAWIITLGLNVGLARFVGDAKSVYLSIYLSIDRSIYLSIYMCICICICICVYV